MTMNNNLIVGKQIIILHVSKEGWEVKEEEEETKQKQVKEMEEKIKSKKVKENPIITEIKITQANYVQGLSAQ